MAGRRCLDSSVVIPYRAGEEEIVKAVTESDELFVSSIVLGELMVGAIKSARPESNLAWIESFAARIRVLDVDFETARVYADVRNALRVAGRPIPENDLWIAATAIRHDLHLAARDAHFESVTDLKLESW